MLSNVTKIYGYTSLLWTEPGLLNPTFWWFAKDVSKIKLHRQAWQLFSSKFQHSMRIFTIRGCCPRFSTGLIVMSMSDQAVLLPKWFPHERIELRKGELDYSYKFWTMTNYDI